MELLEIKTTMWEMKNTLDGNDGELDIIEEKIRETKDIAIKTTKNETQKRECLNEQNINELWNKHNKPQMCVT